MLPLLAVLLVLPSQNGAPIPPEQYDADAEPVPGRRERLGGKVVDHFDKPVAGAQVWFVARPLPANRVVGRPDILRTVTDHRGMFHVQLLAAVPYAAWAHWKDEAGGWFSSFTQEGVVSGRTIKLVPRRARIIPIRLQVRGMHAWSKRSPLSYYLRPSIDTRVRFPITLNEEFETFLPTMPYGESTRLYLDVVASDGSSLARRMIEPDAGWRSIQRERIKRGEFDAFYPDGKTTPIDVELQDIGKPQRVPIRVTTADGKPIAGACVRRSYQFLQGWGVAGQTDEDGQCELLLDYDANPLREPGSVLRKYLCVSASGFADALAGWEFGYMFAGSSYVETPAEGVSITLAPQCPLRGKILMADGVPAAGQQVVVRAEWLLPDRRKRREWDPLQEVPPYHVMTDSNGEFEVLGFPVQARATGATVLLSEDVRRKLVGDNAEYPLAPVQEPFVIGEARPSSLGTVRLTDLECVKLRFLTPEGVTPRSLRVHVESESDNERSRVASSLPIYTDRRGRVSLLLRRQRYVVFAWSSDQGWAIHKLDVRENRKWPETVPLKPFLKLSGQVVTQNGEPCVYGWTSRDTFTDSHRTGYSLAIAKANDALLETWIDRQGRFHLNFIPDPTGHTSVTGITSHYRGGQSYWGRFAFGNASLEDAKIVIEVPDDWFTNKEKYRHRTPRR